MGVDVTDEAVEVLRRSLVLGGVDPKIGGARIRAARGLGGGTDFQVELADGPGPDDEVVEVGGIRVFLDPSLTRSLPDAVVAVEPQHETIVVRPAP